MRKFDLPTSDAVRAALGLKKTTRDLFRLYDSPAEMAADFKATSGKRYNKPASAWSGNVSGPKACELATNGDLSQVAASDAMLAQFESYGLDTTRRAWQDDCAGGVPNVPAFLAGQPLAMRRRTTYRDAAAPLAVIVDLTTTASFTPGQIRRRGIAILALVRALSQRRPIELWAGVMLDANDGRDSVTVMARIETAPLDLATAAHCLTHASFPRLIGHGIADADGYTGSWPYQSYGHPEHRPQMAAMLAPAFSHATETLCLPCMISRDDSIDRPEKWVAEQLARLAPVDLADAA